MGDRVNYVFKSSEREPSLVLYSHWGATDWRIDLANALKAAEARVGDDSYYARIAISHLIGDQWNQELGFGLYPVDKKQSFEDWDFTVIIDMADKVIIERGRDPHPIGAFINYHLSATAIA